MFDIGLPSHKSLFQLQAERIVKLQQLAGAVIPWYVMTSGPTRAPTEAFFRQHGFFGLDAANVVFFEQGVLPCLSNEGKLLMDTKSHVAVAPDGNGGVYLALHKAGVLADMERRGVKHVHAYCVDNALVKIADPVFFGFAVESGLAVATKSVRKLAPDENVGLIVSKGGRPAVVEYSEISAEMAARRDDDGKLKFRTANIVNHYYTVEFLQSLGTAVKLPYHVARKAIPCLPDVPASQPVVKGKNGIKLEQFIFDCFPLLDFGAFGNLEVAREDEFSPLKNKAPDATASPDALATYGAGWTRNDDAVSSRYDLLRQGGRWATAAGAALADGLVGVEISPLVSYAGEGLALEGQTFDCVRLLA
ncbi:nucleotide-diphospho-sugar transferase [Dipodascopsis tothii]|uniref:nucleotide-diphospho-sugar transferase n=1 Tax=Dipodascopsis tothii TaxID=44089 RepID=UPI0034CF6483